VQSNGYKAWGWEVKEQEKPRWDRENDMSTRYPVVKSCPTFGRYASMREYMRRLCARRKMKRVHREDWSNFGPVQGMYLYARKNKLPLKWGDKIDYYTTEAAGKRQIKKYILITTT
jgi:hypothetical protein